MTIRYLKSRFTLALATVALALSAVGASASPRLIPDGQTIDATVNILWQNREITTQTNGQTKTRSFTTDETKSFRIFKVKNELVISMPDFGPRAVFTDGKERIKNAFRIGHGQYLCKKLDQEAGAVGQTCLMYSTQGNWLFVSLRYIGDVYDSSGEYEYVFRINLGGGDCTSELVSGTSRLSNEDGMIPVAGIRGVETLAKARFNGSSCRLVKGRKPF